jgi:hypothetical protein
VPHEPEQQAHYAYEDEDQSNANWTAHNPPRAPAYSGRSYNSIDNIAEFFASRGKKFSAPKTLVEEPKGKKGFKPGQKVRHPKYGEGTVYHREGEGEEAKIPSLRFEEVGREVCPVGKGLGGFRNFVIGSLSNCLVSNYSITQLPNYKSRTQDAFMANTKKLTKEERKKSKRTARKKVKAEKPLKPREYARGSKKRKVKKMVRGAAKR